MNMDFISTRPYILEKILHYSKIPVLLKCRLVCKLWAEEAGRILRKREVTIAFRSMEDIEEFLTVPRPTSQTFSKYIIDVPTIFPMLEDPLGEMNPLIIDLLGCSIEEVKDLKLWYQPLVSSQESVEVTEGADEDDLPITVSDIENNDLVSFVALRKLQLLSNYVQQSTGPRENRKHRIPNYFTRISTPNLRSLTVQHLYDTECSAIITSIIKSSGHHLEYLKIPAKPLPSIEVDPLDNLRELDLLGIFNGFSCSTNETIDAIIRTCPRLEKLGIEFSFRATPPKMQELLHALSSTLIELKCTVQDRNLLARQIIPVHFTFPEMPKLSSLQMRWSNPGFIYYIDRLPILKDLMLDTVWTRKIPGNIYPSGQPFGEGIADYKRLTSLKLSEIVNAEQVKVFSQYFPNLKVLGGSFDSNESLRLVYSAMPQLTSLIIERKSNLTESGGICGIAEDEFVKINEKLKLPNEGDGQDEACPGLERCLPYIGNLKELDTLELCNLGNTWCSIQCGIINLPKLKTLVIQSRTFKKPNLEKEVTMLSQESFLNSISVKMSQLRDLTLWIRHTSERPSAEELHLIGKAMPYVDKLTVVNHSLCGI